jgi:outer membrane autotransporter protein
MGSAKEPASPIMTTTEVRPWEVYGSVFYFTEDQDEQFLTARTVTGAPIRTTVHAETSVDIFGGNAGFEYRFDERWRAGFAIGASTADVDMTFFGSSDIDTLALVPYVSYYQEKAIGNADFYADAMYVYGMNEYDIRRIVGAGITTGSPDGDYHQIELTSGLNYRSGDLVHGPYASLRWLDGTIDSYTESGPGAALFPESDFESLATNLGYQVSYPIRLAGGVLVPQGRAAWEHEFEDDQSAAFGLPGGQIDEDLAILGAGLGYYMNSGWNVGFDYEARLGSETESHYVGLKVGLEF